MKILSFRWPATLALATAITGWSSVASAQVDFTAAGPLKPIEATPVVPVPVDSPELTALPAKAEESKSDDNPTRELIRERFPNGAIRIEREIIQDSEGNFVRDGIYREFDIKGTLFAEGNYIGGHREGIWRRIHKASDSPLFETAPYKDFTGPFYSQATFERNVLHGKWIITDAKERKISEIEFRDGDRHGSAIWYYPNGNMVTQINYDRGRVHGEVIKWGSDSTVLARETYQHGRKVAPRVEYFPNKAKKSEMTFLHAMLYVHTPDNWDKALLAIFDTRGQDERHGPFTIWHPNGNTARQGEFRYNLPVGNVSYWYENGQRQMEGSYSDGKQHGEWTWYYQNGQKSIVGRYNEGKPVGEWTWWKEDGKVAQKLDMSAKRQSPVALGPPQPQDIPVPEVQLSRPTVPAESLR